MHPLIKRSTLTIHLEVMVINFLRSVSQKKKNTSSQHQTLKESQESCSAAATRDILHALAWGSRVASKSDCIEQQASKSCCKMAQHIRWLLHVVPHTQDNEATALQNTFPRQTLRVLSSPPPPPPRCLRFHRLADPASGSNQEPKKTATEQYIGEYIVCAGCLSDVLQTFL